MTCPYVLDHIVTDAQAEALLRAKGPVVQVELPGGVVAWHTNTAAKHDEDHGHRLGTPVEAMRPLTEQLVADLLNGLSAARDGTVDLRADFAHPLALAGIVNCAPDMSKHEAGAMAVANLITTAVLLLLAQPDRLELVRLGHATWDDVVEETLRREPAITHPPLRHTAQHLDTTEHLDAGHGEHHCFGAPLARLQAAIALSALFQRFPRLRLAVPDGCGLHVELGPDIGNT